MCSRNSLLGLAAFQLKDKTGIITVATGLLQWMHFSLEFYFLVIWIADSNLLKYVDSQDKTLKQATSQGIILTFCKLEIY